MEVTTELINALHFRRGIQNMQVVDMEWEIPIPAQPVASKRHSVPVSTSKSNGLQRRLSKKAITRRTRSTSKKSLEISRPTLVDPAAEEEIVQTPFVETGEYTSFGVKRDWTITQRAWWDAILLMEEDPSVVRVSLEMRIMGGSEIILAPQKRNVLGTTAIEILSTLNTPPDDWMAFCQKVAGKWTSYKDGTTGKRLHARPHWCKQWSFLNLPDDNGVWMVSEEWMRKVAYKDAIPEFWRAVNKIGERAGFTIDDLRARFGNELLESVFWTGEVPTDPVVSDDKSRIAVNKFKKWLKKIFS
jgi:hypothetical protein